MVVVKSKLNGKNTFHALKFQTQKAKKSILICSVIIFLIGMLFIGLAIKNKTNQNLLIYYSVAGVLFALIGVFYMPLIKWLNKKQQAKTNDSMNLLSDETEITYKFEENKLFIYITRGTKYREVTEMDYDIITEVCEDNETIVLFISNMQVYVINKADIVSGTVEDIRSILGKYFIGDKYKIEMK